MPEEEQEEQQEKKKSWFKWWYLLILIYIIFIIATNILQKQNIISKWIFWFILVIPPSLSFLLWVKTLIYKGNKEELEEIRAITGLSKGTQKKCREYIKHLMFKKGTEIKINHETEEGLTALGTSKNIVYWLIVLDYPYRKKWFCGCRTDNHELSFATQNEKKFEKMLTKLAEEYTEPKKIVKRFLGSAGEVVREEEVTEPQERIIDIKPAEESILGS